MAKRRDGGAERAKGRARAQQNRRSEQFAVGLGQRHPFAPPAGSQISNLLFGPNDPRVSEMGAGGYKTAVVRAAQAIGRRMLPKNVGVHHSVTGTSGKPFTGAVRPSGSTGRTAQDQIAGNSYYWNTGGRGGISRATREVDFQTRKIADDWLLDPGQRASAYVVRAPRGLSQADPNLPGSHARMVQGKLDVFRGVVSSGPRSATGMTPFQPQDLVKISRAIKQAKAVEAAKSAAKIGSIPAGGAVGAWANQRRR